MLRGYFDGPGFADCYVTELAGAFTQADFIRGFYTSPLFKLERTLLTRLASSPATDAQAAQLAAGTLSRFSAWRVEAQSTSELLLADITGRTRSWLMVRQITGPANAVLTQLYFGSAVVPQKAQGSAKARMGFVFHALLGFHRLYSRLLLCAASRRMGQA